MILKNNKTKQNITCWRSFSELRIIISLAGDIISHSGLDSAISTYL